MTTDPVYQLCPVCKNKTLTKHCQTATCHWHKCRNNTCMVTLDLGAGVGFGKSPNFVKVELGGTANP